MSRQPIPEHHGGHTPPSDIARRLHDLHSDYLDVRLPHIVEQMLEHVDSLGEGPDKERAKAILSDLFIFSHELRKHTLFEEKMLGDMNSESPLSERETEVLVELAHGLSNKEIADRLNISIHTVISHRKNIVHKTGITTLPELTLYALSRRLLSPQMGMNAPEKS